MRIFFTLLISVLLFACGGENTALIDENPESIRDTTAAEIVEFDLDENRLSAVEFNNKLSLAQIHIIDQIDLLFLSDSGKAKVNYENTVFEIELVLTDIEKTNSIANGEAFKNSLIELLLFYKKELNTDFLTVLPFIEKGNLRTEAELEELQVYDDVFATKERSFFKIILNEQEKFAKANDIKLTNP